MKNIKDADTVEDADEGGDEGGEWASVLRVLQCKSNMAVFVCRMGEFRI